MAVKDPFPEFTKSLSEIDPQGAAQARKELISDPQPRTWVGQALHAGEWALGGLGDVASKALWIPLAESVTTDPEALSRLEDLKKEKEHPVFAGDVLAAAGALRPDPNDPWYEKFAKSAGRFAASVAGDPLTYVPFGSLTKVGKATELAKAAVAEGRTIEEGSKVYNQIAKTLGHDVLNPKPQEVQAIINKATADILTRVDPKIVARVAREKGLSEESLRAQLGGYFTTENVNIGTRVPAGKKIYLGSEAHQQIVKNLGYDPVMAGEVKLRYLPLAPVGKSLGVPFHLPQEAKAELRGLLDKWDLAASADAAGGLGRTIEEVKQLVKPIDAELETLQKEFLAGNQEREIIPSHLAGRDKSHLANLQLGIAKATAAGRSDLADEIAQTFAKTREELLLEKPFPITNRTLREFKQLPEVKALVAKKELIKGDYLKLLKQDPQARYLRLVDSGDQSEAGRAFLSRQTELLRKYPLTSRVAMGKLEKEAAKLAPILNQAGRSDILKLSGPDFYIAARRLALPELNDVLDKMRVYKGLVNSARNREGIIAATAKSFIKTGPPDVVKVKAATEELAREIKQNLIKKNIQELPTAAGKPLAEQIKSGERTLAHFSLPGGAEIKIPGISSGPVAEGIAKLFSKVNRLGFVSRVEKSFKKAFSTATGNKDFDKLWTRFKSLALHRAGLEIKTSIENEKTLTKLAKSLKTSPEQLKAIVDSSVERATAGAPERGIRALISPVAHYIEGSRGKATAALSKAMEAVTWKPPEELKGPQVEGVAKQVPVETGTVKPIGTIQPKIVDPIAEELKKEPLPTALKKPTKFSEVSLFAEEKGTKGTTNWGADLDRVASNLNKIDVTTKRGHLQLEQIRNVVTARLNELEVLERNPAKAYKALRGLSSKAPTALRELIGEGAFGTRDKIRLEIANLEDFRSHVDFYRRESAKSGAALGILRAEPLPKIATEVQKLMSEQTRVSTEAYNPGPLPQFIRDMKERKARIEADMRTSGVGSIPVVTQPQFIRHSTTDEANAQVKEYLLKKGRLRLGQSVGKFEIEKNKLFREQMVMVDPDKVDQLALSHPDRITERQALGLKGKRGLEKLDALRDNHTISDTEYNNTVYTLGPADVNELAAKGYFPWQTTKDPIFYSDPIFSSSVRGVIGQQARTATEFYQELIKRGLAVKEGVAPAGYRTVPQPQLKGYLFPPEVALALSRFQKMGYSDKAIADFIKAHDTIQDAWKAWTLAIFPAYHTRNFVGNLWNNWLAGIVDPKHYILAGRLQAKDAFTFKDGLGKVWKSSEIVQKLKELGVVDRGWVGAEISPGSIAEQVKSGSLLSLGQKNKVVELGFTIGKAIENNARAAHVLAKMADGMTIEDAALSAKKYLFDYGDLTDFERNVMKRWFPFYTWTRKNIPLQLEHLVTQPAKFSVLYKAKRAIEDDTQAPNEKYLPQWVIENFPTRIRYDEKNKTYEYFIANTWLPAMDLTKLLELHETAGNMLTPVPKEILQQLFNYDFFLKKKIQTIPGEKQRLVGVDLPTRVVHGAKLVRLLNEIDRIMQQDSTPEAKLLHAITGKTFTYDEQKARIANKREVDQRIKELKGGYIHQALQPSPNLKEMQRIKALIQETARQY